MKKLKYLLGLFAFGLFIGQSFGYDQYVYVDGVTTPLLAGGEYSNYLYTFQNYGFFPGVSDELDSSTRPDNPYYNYFGYSLYYNGNTQLDNLYYQCQNGYCDSSKFGQYYNNSAFGLSLYTGRTFSNSSYTWSVNKSNNFGPISVFLGVNSDLGNNFISVGSIAGGDTKSPVYGIGNNFFDGSSSYLKISASDYYRLFFKQNINLSSPLDGLDLTYLSGSNKTGSYGWEYFYPRGTRTNFGYIIDDGQLYNKYKHFGLFSYGYSYSYILGNNTIDSLSWNDLKLVTVDDSIYDYQRLFGDVSNSEFQHLSWRGILVLRGNSYITRGQDNGVYLLSKNSNNPKQILYEHWSCDTSNLDVIFSGGNSTVGSCIKLDGGFLTYNGSTEVLPFNDFSSIISGDSSSYPFVTSIIKGNDINSSHGYTKISNNCLYINSDSVCYGFSTNTGVNIRDIYLTENPDSGSSDNSRVGSGSSIVPYSSLYYQCLGPSYNTPDGLPPAFCLNPDGSLIDFTDYQNCYFTITGSGDLIQDIFCNNEGYIQEMSWVSDGSGGYLVPCQGDSCGAMYTFGPDYLVPGTGFVLSTGLVEDMFTNVTGWVGRCPFPYTDFQLGKDSPVLKYFRSLGFKFDPFILVNCMVAGFNYGRHTIDYQMFGDTFEHPLIYGTGEKYRLLCSFFDFVVILGLIGFVVFVKKLF